MFNYTPSIHYKKILKQQDKLLVISDELLSLSGGELDSSNNKKLTVIIEVNSGCEHSLKASLGSLDVLKNEIDCIFFLHETSKDKYKINKEDLIYTERKIINRMLTSLLVNTSFSYTIDSKSNFIKGISDIQTELLIWCKVPVVFYPNSFKALLNSHKSDENILTAIYSDHDLLYNGKRINPSFKPEINVDWLLCSNYIGNVVLFNKVHFENITNNLQLSLICAVKFDMLHELLKIMATDSLYLIKHIPFVLYSEQSFEKEALIGKVPPLPVKRINWLLPKKLPLVSIIIPTRNSKELVEQCIESLYKLTDYNNFEVLLVNNDSDDLESIQYFKQLAYEEKVKLLNYNAPFNYSAINNFAVKYAKGEIFLFMNNDIELLHKDWLEEMVMQVMREDIGCVGAKLYYPNMTIQHAGVIVGLWGCAGHSHKHFKQTDNGYMNRLHVVQNYSAVTAACMAVRKTVFNAAEGFNEENLSVAFNDVDLCLKIQAIGYRNLWTPYAEMIHHESSSRGSEDTPEKKAREAKEIAYMQSTWHLDSDIDPAYSPWLTAQKEDFSFGLRKNSKHVK